MNDKCKLCDTPLVLLSYSTRRGNYCPRCGNQDNLHYWDECNDCKYLVYTTDKEFTLCPECSEKRKRQYMEVEEHHG